jgi:hypothetical protein
MAPDPSPIRPVGITLEARQETLSYQDVADILHLGSAKTPYPKVSPSSSDDIVPQKTDVVCGRDKEAYGHVGNRRFRVLISLHRDNYQNAKTRDTKTNITKEIVASIRECGGRFLRKDEQTDMWYVVGYDYAHEKVSHALRSAKDPERKCKKKQKAKDQPPTREEHNAFQTLLLQQQKIFRELLEENQLSEALDFEGEEQCCSISV